MRTEYGDLRAVDTNRNTRLIRPPSPFISLDQVSRRRLSLPVWLPASVRPMGTPPFGLRVRELEESR